MSGGYLPPAEELLSLLLRGAVGRHGQCRRRSRSSDGGLDPTGVGEGVAKQILLVDLGKLAVKETAAPSGCLRGENIAVEGPHGGEVRVVPDPFQRRVRLGECPVMGGVAPVVSCLLSCRALLLEDDDTRAEGPLPPR